MGTIIKIAKHIITKINVAAAFNGLGIFVVTIVSEILSHFFFTFLYLTSLRLSPKLQVFKIVFLYDI